MSWLDDITRLRPLQTISICPENPTGAPGQAALATEGSASAAARDLGRGWKVNPYVTIEPGQTHQLAWIDGPGRIRHLWATVDRPHWRSLVLRAYWDGADEPAVEVPYGDFFGNGWGVYAPLSSLMVAANPHGGMNSYWPMPFQTGARLTLENIGHQSACVYYQVNAELGETDQEQGYLHAQFRRSNPLPLGTTHTIAEEVHGQGSYVGTYLAWGTNTNGWWGEGEVKFWLDDDRDDPSIASTGLEDYFGGAWNWDVNGGFNTYSTPFLGMHQVICPNGLYSAQQRFGMYRWHVPDPVRFAHRLGRVEVQALGWYPDGRYKPLTEDIASTCWFYLDQPTANRPALPDRDQLSV
ncbi:MAG: DUF2961 domain-containing protein [Actinomycetia bacterium]|nr:DUF2961 domain-containing protein [Actinomycetes bacterium]